MNPCMDCHTLMFAEAGAMMAKIGADFLFSGEVVGQRPKSQTKNSLRYVEKNCGFEGLILRPLSAGLLPETIAEQKGLVDRRRLLSISGRSRKPPDRTGKKIRYHGIPISCRRMPAHGEGVFPAVKRSSICPENRR